MEETFELFYEYCWENGIRQCEPNKERFNSVGRSEFYKITGSNNAKRDVVMKKTFSKHINTVPTSFGNIFEMSTQHICEILLNCEVCEMPASYKNHDDPYNSASLDGMGLVSIGPRTLKMIVNNFCAKKLDKKKLRRACLHIPISETDIGTGSLCKVPVLFEFKTPFSRKINGKICPDYRFQVMSGLHMFPICKLGIFFEAEIKCCLEEHLWFNNLHYTDDFYVSESVEKNIFFICMKFLFSTENYKSSKPFYHHNVVRKCTNPDWIRLNFYEDYYAVDGPIFRKNNNIIEIIHSTEMLNIYNYKPMLPNVLNQENILKFYMELGSSLCSFTTCFAYIPWKVINYNFAIFNPYPGFCDLWKDEVKSVIECVRIARKIPDDDDKKIYIKSVFG